MNAIDIVKEQAAAYDAGKSFAVVTIVQSDGSTPRSSGKMIVYLVYWPTPFPPE